MTQEQLYKVYAAWSGQLHHYVIKELGAHIDCEFFPGTWKFALYSGYAQDKPLNVWGFSTVPGLVRPVGEARELIQLPRPEDNPSQEELDNAFRGLCLAAARILEIDLGKPKLGTPEKSMLKHALPKKKKKR
jgi:hypothetical protein